MSSGFAGMYPMLSVFFAADGTIDERALRREVEAAIASGVQGVAVMGLASEINKLSEAERRRVVEVVAEAVGGRCPLSVTVGENTPAGQIAFARAAVAAGARWLVLQPPPARDVSEASLVRFFGQVADALPVPLGIQNATQYLGIGLSDQGLAALHRQHPNVAIVKVEDEPLAVARLIEATGGALDVFLGRGGLGFIDCWRAGAVGFIPGFECCDHLARAYGALIAGREAEAEAAYAAIEPAVVFLERSINHFVTYAKEIAARRLCLGPVHHRLGTDIPPFGHAIIARAAARLGPFPT